jgi:phosphomannomutase
MASTPAMFMSIVYPETAFDGSCMITASHLPFNRNGLKFFAADGGLDKPDITRILELAEGYAQDDGFAEVSRESEADKAEQFDLIALYAKRLRETIAAELGEDTQLPLTGLHIVVDAGNGAGGFFAKQVLEPLGADISGSRYLDPDGTFPNHQPNPENTEAMESICEATTESGADLGLIFDTDVDRMSAVFANGTPVNRDAIIALVSAILAPAHPGSTIITDSVTSDRLTAFLEGELGLKHLSFKRGYKNVINKCRELNAAGTESPLAMETSGHGCLKENYYLDDGAFLAVRIVIAAARAKREGRHLEALIAGLDRVYADAEVRFAIGCEDFGGYGQQVLKEFRVRAEAAGYELPVAYEGVRIRFSKESDGVVGWLLLRASLHDPVMVLNMESTDEAGLSRIREAAQTLLEGFDQLDLSVL